MQIDILGASFSIQADEDPEYLQALLNYYRKTIDKIELSVAVTDPLKSSIIAGILLADELYKERLKTNPHIAEAEQQEAERRALNMIKAIDSIL